MRFVTTVSCSLLATTLLACGSSSTQAPVATPGDAPPAATALDSAPPSIGEDDAVTGGVLEEALIGPVWWLAGATVDGKPIPPKESIFRRARFQFVDDFGCNYSECRDGLTLVGNDACNDFATDIMLDGSTVTIGTDGESTMVGCDDDLTTAFGRALAGAFDVAVAVTTLDETELVVSTSDGAVELRFRNDPDPFGPTTQDIVATGMVGDVAYRIAWEGTDGGGGTGGVLESLDTTVTAFRRGASGIGLSPGFPLDANLRDFGSDRFVYGVAQPDAARVEYRTIDERPVELTLLDVPDATALVFAEVIDNDGEPWNVISYDAAGAELARIER